MTLSRGGLLLLFLVQGLVLGLAGAFVQSQRIIVDLPWGTPVVPWGVPVAWIALIAAVRGATWAARTRWAGWILAAGWLVVTVALSVESPSGDVALSGGGRQLVYLLGGVVLASAAATLPLPLRRSVVPVPGTDDARDSSDAEAGT